jgi:hypothetical protein
MSDFLLPLGGGRWQFMRVVGRTDQQVRQGVLAARGKFGATAIAQAVTEIENEIKKAEAEVAIMENNRDDYSTSIQDAAQFPPEAQAFTNLQAIASQRVRETQAYINRLRPMLQTMIQVKQQKEQASVAA